jgi:hypothetical protein
VLAAGRNEGALHVGYSPNSMSSTRRHCTPGGVSFACLHAAVQVWQPTQRRRSATIAQRVMTDPPEGHAHDVGARSGCVGQRDRHRHQRIHLGHAESFATGVAQCSNWPISSSVSGRMPSRSTTRAARVRAGVAISIVSPSEIPSRRRAPDS